MLSARGRHAVEAQAAAAHVEAGTCADEERGIAARVTDRDELLSSAENADDVEVTGKRATVKTAAGDYSLEDVAGNWKVAPPDALLGLKLPQRRETTTPSVPRRPRMPRSKQEGVPET